MQEFCVIFYIGGGRFASQKALFGGSNVSSGLAKTSKSVFEAVWNVCRFNRKGCSIEIGSNAMGSDSCAFLRAACNCR